MLIPSLKNHVKLFTLGAVALLLAGCVTVPDAIKGTTETPQQDFLAVKEAPNIYVGQEARFGGTVVSVENTSRDRTRLEIASVPLDSWGRPILGEPSQGRLFANVNGFLDPTDFRGHLVTIVGPIVGSEEGKIGSTPYRFIVIDAIGYKRWNLRQEVILPPGLPMWGPGFATGPRFRNGHPYPWGWYAPPMPAQIHTVVTE